MTTKKVSKNTNKIVIDKIKQDWFVRTYDDISGTPHIIIDNWFTEKELKCVWHELQYYNLRRNVIKANKADDTAKDYKGRAKSNAYRFYIDQYYTRTGRDISPINYCMYKKKAKQFHN